jgi:3-oxoacyl-[acyl-carrier protein] reductase
MPQKLAGKVAIVTGSSKGIGAAIAKDGGKALALKADLTKKAAIEHLVAETVRHFGPIDILVNNAGVFEFRSLEEITEEHFHRQFDLNVLGLLLMTQQAVKHFNPAGGSIINISSLASTEGLPNSAVYAGTKGAVDVISKVLGRELGGRNIRVNSINPGLVETEGTTTAGFMTPEIKQSVGAKTSFGRIGQPEDIAKAVLFFATTDSLWISGQTLLVTGGQS